MVDIKIRKLAMMFARGNLFIHPADIQIFRLSGEEYELLHFLWEVRKHEF